MQLGAVACVGAVTVVWLMAPSFLYPRFFLWLSPVVAVAVAVAVAKRPNAIVLVLVLVLVGLQVHTAWTPLTTDVYPNREAGRGLRRGEQARRHPLRDGHLHGPATRRVHDALHIPGSPRATKQCTVAFKIGPPSAQIQRDLARVFPYRETLNAQTPGRSLVGSADDVLDVEGRRNRLHTDEAERALTRSRRRSISERASGAVARVGAAWRELTGTRGQRDRPLGRVPTARQRDGIGVLDSALQHEVRVCTRRHHVEAGRVRMRILLREVRNDRGSRCVERRLTRRRLGGVR